MTSMRIGSKVEILQKKEKVNIYSFTSVIQDIIDDFTIIIEHPILNDKFVTLKVEDIYSLLIIVDNIIFNCDCKINKIFKDNSAHKVELKIISEIIKLQRRDYFRYNCFILLKFTQLSGDDSNKNKDIHQGMIIDISGGGIKFKSNADLDVNGTNLKCFFIIRGELIVSIGKLLAKRALYESLYKLEYRIKFITILPDDREKIIQFIFNEQRKKLNITRKQE